MKIIAYCYCLLLLTVTHNIYASIVSMDDPEPYARASENRRYIVAVAPPFYRYEKGQKVLEQPDVAIVYRVNKDATLTSLWQVEEGYGAYNLLSNDGQYLVNLENWFAGDKASSEDQALSFYKEGKLIKRYSTDDLILDPGKVRIVNYDYIWLSNDHQIRLGDGKLVLLTSEQYRLEFSLETGEVLSRTQIP